MEEQVEREVDRCTQRIGGEGTSTCTKHTCIYNVMYIMCACTCVTYGSMDLHGCSI